MGAVVETCGHVHGTCAHNSSSRRRREPPLSSSIQALLQRLQRSLQLHAADLLGAFLSLCSLTAAGWWLYLLHTAASIMPLSTIPDPCCPAKPIPLLKWLWAMQLLGAAVPQAVLLLSMQWAAARCAKADCQRWRHVGQLVLEGATHVAHVHPRPSLLLLLLGEGVKDLLLLLLLRCWRLQ